MVRDRKDYLREYMRKRRAGLPRICPDCNILVLDIGHRYCGECAEDRKAISEIISSAKKHKRARKRRLKRKIHLCREYCLKYL